MVRSLADRTFQLRCGNQTWGHGCAYDAHGRLDISRRRVDLHVAVVNCTSFCTKLAVRGRSVANLVERFDIEPYSDFSAK